MTERGWQIHTAVVLRDSRVIRLLGPHTLAACDRLAETIADLSGVPYCPGHEGRAIVGLAPEQAGHPSVRFKRRYTNPDMLAEIAALVALFSLWLMTQGVF